MGKGIVKLGEGNWAVKDGNLLAAKETNGRFKNAEFTVDRGTDATYVGRDGLIVNETGDDTPRIDFTDNTDGHLLLEPESRNLITYSEDFSGWTFLGNTDINATNITSPSGENNATNITGLNGSGSNDLRKQLTYNTANKTLTFSVYLKGSGTLRLQMSNGVDQGLQEVITLTNQWERYSVSGTFNSTSVSIFYLVVDDYSGLTATSYDIWGAQLEELSHPTSYIPTNGSPVTRDAETCTGAGETADFNSEEGVLYAEIAALADDISGFRVLGISDGGSTNRIFIGYTSNNIYANVGADTTIGSPYTPTNASNFHKVALKYENNNCKFFVDGSQIGITTTSITIPSGMNSLQFDSGAGSSDFYGKCKAIRVYKEALSDTELENLTSL